MKTKYRAAICGAMCKETLVLATIKGAPILSVQMFWVEGHSVGLGVITGGVLWEPAVQEGFFADQVSFWTPERDASSGLQFFFFSSPVVIRVSLQVWTARMEAHHYALLAAALVGAQGMGLGLWGLSNGLEPGLSA